MIIGVPKEIKIHEYRVGLTPAGIKALIADGAKLIVEKSAGEGSGFSDAEYEQVGAKIIPTKKEVYATADMIIKVKEPIAEEFPLMKENQVLYTYLHLAVERELAQVFVDKKITAIAYETIEEEDGTLPLLVPMSEVAGKLSTQFGATYLQKNHGGKGVLLGGTPGVRRGKVTVIGGGIVGINAAKIAMGLGARVTILDIDPKRLRYLDDVFGSKLTTMMGTPENIENSVISSDLVIGAVLITGAKAPKLVTRDMVKKMEKGSVIVDVAVDQGGCIETVKATSYDKPTYIEEGVIHCCVANMPGAVSKTSTLALTNVTLSYAKTLVKEGPLNAIKKHRALALGVNTHKGFITYKAVAEGLNMEYKPLKDLL